METLRGLVSHKNKNTTEKDQWEEVQTAWYKLCFSESEPWRVENFLEKNPWSDWCEALDKWMRSGKKPPKSEKQLSRLWSALSYVAAVTSTALKEAKKTSEELGTTKTELMAYKIQVYKEQNKVKTLEEQILNLTRQVSWSEENLKEMSENIVDFQSQLREKEQAFRVASNDLHGKVLDLENQLRKKEQAFNDLQGKVLDRENQLRKKEQAFRVAFNDLHGKVLDLENQLKEQKKRVRLYKDEREVLERKVAEMKSNYDEDNKTVVLFRDASFKQEGPSRKCWLPLPEIDQEISLTVCEVMEVADRMGPVMAGNVIEWLYRCYLEKKVEGWTNRDVTRVLRKCLAVNLFSVLPEEVQTGRAQWLVICQHVVNVFNPTESVDEMLRYEKKRITEPVGQYFDRMWMMYLIVKQSENVSRDDREYRQLIWRGLDSRLMIFAPDYRLSNYAEFEKRLRPYDNSMEEEEADWRIKARKAGVGCPPRWSIWRRLEAYEDPRQTVNNAPYWKLVVRLSKFEDLETKMPLKPTTTADAPCNHLKGEPVKDLSTTGMLGQI
ncbi:uncharacterized protein LOC128492653 isoform X2 [Spea bombifrons]|uniref:uncharacterized protein LOC128492653 isoform X2 n=1 Tax=Spea bombifrons TaxID=233779 RepID=UPI00234AB6EA|nr:uncharacterized protein LOC128492653 isoform X2 [Spea bombifrons]